MSAELLPPNATRLERSLADATARISHVDITAVNGLWDPDACPVDLLPWLAWAEGVPEWSSQWPVTVQRNAIKSARKVRRRRGTTNAVIEALTALDLGVNLTEWFDYPVTPGTPGTFRLDAELSDRGLTQEEQNSIERVVLNSKNARSHLDVFNIVLTESGPLYYGTAQQSGDETVIYPLIITELQASGPAFHAITAYDVETTTINPLL